MYLIISMHEWIRNDNGYQDIVIRKG